MAIKQCCIRDCKSTTLTKRLFRFPVHKRLRQIWIEKVQPFTDFDLKGRKEVKICELHFQMGDVVRPRRRFMSCPLLFTKDEIKTGEPHNLNSNLARLVKFFHCYARKPGAYTETNAINRGILETIRKINHDHRYFSLHILDDLPSTQEPLKNVPSQKRQTQTEDRLISLIRANLGCEYGRQLKSQKNMSSKSRKPIAKLQKLKLTVQPIQDPQISGNQSPTQPSLDSECEKSSSGRDLGSQKQTRSKNATQVPKFRYTILPPTEDPYIPPIQETPKPLNQDFPITPSQDLQIPPSQDHSTHTQDSPIPLTLEHPVPFTLEHPITQNSYWKLNCKTGRISKEWEPKETHKIKKAQPITREEFSVSAPKKLEPSTKRQEDSSHLALEFCEVPTLAQGLCTEAYFFPEYPLSTPDPSGICAEFSMPLPAEESHFADDDFAEISMPNDTIVEKPHFAQDDKAEFTSPTPEEDQDDLAVAISREDGARLDEDAATEIISKLADFIEAAAFAGVGGRNLAFEGAKLMSVGFLIVNPLNADAMDWLLGCEFDEIAGVPLSVKRLGCCRVTIWLPRHQLKNWRGTPRANPFRLLQYQNDYKKELRMEEWILINREMLEKGERVTLGVPEGIIIDHVWLNYQTKTVKAKRVKYSEKSSHNTEIANRGCTCGPCPIHKTT